MKEPLLLSGVSLKVKLVLSHIGVALGTIITLTLAIGLAAQNFINYEQHVALNKLAQFYANQLEFRYQHNGGNWDRLSTTFNVPIIIAAVDTHNVVQVCVLPGSSDVNTCEDAKVKDALTNALDGKPETGDMEFSSREGIFHTAYIAQPLYVNDQIIGAMFLSSPEPRLGLNNNLVTEVNRTILLTAVLVALGATLFSLFLAHRLMNPLKSLTQAAEQMKLGHYTERVAAPQAQDEIGQLAQTFNEMADTIEADVNELRRQEQARRELLANIAHDLATPLTAIQGFSEALADDMISHPQERQETAQRIAREVQRLRRMVAELQQMTSLESGRVRLDLAPLNMHTLVEETLTVIAPECEQMDIHLHNEIAPSVPPVMADSDRITQVLFNLLDNARRHTPHGGSICVGARTISQSRSLQVWVSDTGEGIDPASLPHIFERFYRADRSRTATTGGSGLGLSIVKVIITAHGGTVNAESIPGQGTRIIFTLPLAAASSQQPALAQEASMS
jgi:two-component system sensor histidine kinase BaeS